MYVPDRYAAAGPDELLAEFAAHRLAILVTAGADGSPFATHLPMIWDAEKRMLEGHVARANPHARSAAAQALVILPGPEAYVSPSFYPSKASDPRTVPTWNYEAVHVSGPLEWFEDAAGLEANVRALTDRHEQGRAAPWSLDDAPPAYTAGMLRGIVGVRVIAANIHAKQKLSQNKSAEDRAGVEAGLSAGDAHEQLVAARMKATRET